MVDDDPGVLSVAVTMLESLGHRVTTAIDGPSALRWIKEGGPFDLMLTDIVLPGSMNGVQLANTALEQRPGLRVLLMSGYAEEALMRAGFSRGSPAQAVSSPRAGREAAARFRPLLAGLLSGR